jgi:hypothetical protein
VPARARGPRGDGDDRLAEDDQREEGPAFREVAAARRDASMEAGRDGWEAQLERERDRPDDIPDGWVEGEREEPHRDAGCVTGAVQADRRPGPRATRASRAPASTCGCTRRRPRSRRCGRRARRLRSGRPWPRSPAWLRSRRSGSRGRPCRSGWRRPCTPATRRRPVRRGPRSGGSRRPSGRPRAGARAA